MKYNCGNCAYGQQVVKYETCYCSLYKKEFDYEDFCKNHEEK